uniref:Protein kinase domain-containing protein n=1 Tax=Helicotheca tamesis TaxID=374047 RepID=A0A7S2MX87_9STRA|mmetsp:Transcript_5301/g.7276  ORF Transcript_5301/g.7276 Transcript_5301/m.7276 type:complete len:496 (+) Transcript_5301:137-1624(+)|eukprot:CAMPEP_0185728298 /NCGR_PEP_ID=MMETSP1171-20130828/3688_1 /TAXON_ID=374046 /ORGANISM="Helicotheca tamensis, Strain CCMP826" /LENGTH=495 /DNA_ID=CAMNT_0028396989 /DNA_START=70 /DNA_END=1557 /DNA_ORIENTATION=-
MKLPSAALLVALAGATTTHAFVTPSAAVGSSASTRSVTSSFPTTKANEPSIPSKSNGRNVVTIMMAQIPTIDNWRVLRSGRLTGVVSNHPTYGDGETITTSALADPKAGSDGVIVVTLSGSKYKLGAKYGATAVKSASQMRNGKAKPQEKKEAKKPAVAVAAKNIAAKKATAAPPAPSKPAPAPSPPSLEKRLREARKKYNLSGQSVGFGKYLLAGRPKRSTSGKSQIWTAYRADEEGLPTGDPVTVKLSANIDAIERESANYNLVTSGLFAGRFVNKIEFLPEAGDMKGRMANLCALIIENGDLDLKAYMMSRKQKGLTGRDMRDAAAAAAQCVQAMHSSNMVWTDLKTENFVVQQQNGASLSVKGIDLESARKMKGNPVDYSPEACPPEFANAFIAGDGPSFVLEPSYDMWSLGMMLYELSVGKPYFDGKSPIQITKTLRYEGFEADVSAVKDDKLRDLIGQCLKFNPKERPSITAFLLHPYFLTTGIGPFSF